MLALFSVAIFSGALLLFLVQPMVAKLILPLLGGTPGVWNTCMVFFQAALLSGYAYAHALSRLRSVRTQVIIHAILLVAMVVFLPIGLPTGEAWKPPAEQTPVWWTLLVLLKAAGGPFFIAAATGPLVQRWFSRTDHPHARDPYFLYAASNAGSLIALIAYPLLVEPAVGVRGQAWGWAGAYVLQGLLLVCCGVWMLRRLAPAPAGVGATTSERPRWSDRARWVALAAVPSSLMLGATTYLTLDVAAVPLFWIVPLAIYLLTFIIAFGPGGTRLGRWSGWLLAPLVVVTAVVYALDLREPIGFLFALHLGVLLLAGLALHGRLAGERPAADRLTEFFLLLALGGVLGGAFNALLAPVLFTTLAEFPIALVAALLLAPRFPRAGEATIPPRTHRVAGALDVLLPACVALTLVASQLKWMDYWAIVPAVSRAWQTLGLPWTPVNWNAAIGLAIPVLITLLLIPDRVRFALAAGALLLVPKLIAIYSPEVIHAERTFFTTLSVRRLGGGPSPAANDAGVSGENADNAGRARTVDGVEPRAPRITHDFYHGRIIHGTQLDFGPAPEPTAYFSRPGPVGDVWDALSEARASEGGALRRVAVVGMGIAVLAAYGQPGQEFTFYEIDPGVVRIAQKPALFTYYRQCQATTRTVLGDGRLTLAAAPAGHYDLIFLDAFSSDAVPIHLLTREAIEGYLRTLAPGGVLMFNVTNRYVDLEPVLARAAAELGLTALVRDEDRLTLERTRQGHTISKWVALTRPSAADDVAARLRGRLVEPWRAADVRADVRLWTDDYANILSVLKWRDPPRRPRPEPVRAEDLKP